MIDDMTALRECWTDVQPPSPAAQERARAALLARVAETGGAPAGARSASVWTRNRRWSGWAWRSGIATVAAAVAGGLVLVGGFGAGTTGQPAAPPSRSVAIELAAVYAAGQPFTAPRPDQWTYVELRMVSPGKIAQSKGQRTDVTSQSWTRADGKQEADIDNGKLEIGRPGEYTTHSFPPKDYPTLAGLPTDPQQLLNWARGPRNAFTDTAEARDQQAFNAITTILRDNLLPPAVEAALLRALALIPGVGQAAESVEIDGRPAIAVGRVQEGWLRSDILLDPATHEFLGGRDIAIADFGFTNGPEGAQPGGVTGGGPTARVRPGAPAGATGGTFHISKGEIQSMMTRTAIRIVDAPGKTA